MKNIVHLVISPILLFTALIFHAIGTRAEEVPLGVLLMAGDITGCSSAELKNAEKTASLLSMQIERLKAANVPVRVLLLGDLAYDDGTRANFSCFEKTWGETLRHDLTAPDTDIMPIPGNHEYHTEGAVGFFEAFKTNAFINQNDQAYYEAVFPQSPEPNDAWRIIGLNSEIENDVASVQHAWLAQQIQGAKQKCILAFWHRPVFSSGEHGHEGGVNGAPVKQEPIADIESLLAKHGGSLVINGHDHDYEELMPHDENGRADPQGIRSFVVGTGGRKLRPLKGKRWKGISGNFEAKSHGILRLDLFVGHYAWAFLPTDDRTTKYSGAATCRTRPAN
jgi:acid phosphatase type 7